MRRISGTKAAVCSILVAAGAAQADSLLWSDCNNFGPGGDIQRSRLDGSGQATLIPRLDGPTGIAFNPADGMMYWAQGDDNTNTGTIHRANLNGTGIQQIVSGQQFTTGLAVDPVGGHVFWRTHSSPNEPFGDDIRRANLDGTGRQTVVHSPTLDGNGNLALDLAGGSIYYAGYLDGLIRRANLDGTGQPTTLISGLAGPVGIALDVPHGKLYFADFGGDAIYQANLDGTGQQLVIGNLPGPSGLALDLDAGKIYWTDGSGNDLGAGDIRRANLDGSDPQTLVQGLNAPFAITIVPLVGDANRDGRVDFTDLLALAQHYGTLTGATRAEGDFNGDGKVDFQDLLLLARHYGTTDSGPALSAVPEPSGLLLLAGLSAFGGCNLRQRRRSPNVQRPSVVA